MEIFENCQRKTLLNYKKNKSLRFFEKNERNDLYVSTVEKIKKKYNKIQYDAVFRRVETFLQNLGLKLFFSIDVLHVILERRNLEIRRHPNFSIVYELCF